MPKCYQQLQAKIKKNAVQKKIVLYNGKKGPHDYKKTLRRSINWLLMHV